MTNVNFTGWYVEFNINRSREISSSSFSFFGEVSRERSLADLMANVNFTWISSVHAFF